MCQIYEWRIQILNTLFLRTLVCSNINLFIHLIGCSKSDLRKNVALKQGQSGVIDGNQSAKGRPSPLTLLYSWFKTPERAGWDWVKPPKYWLVVPRTALQLIASLTLLILIRKKCWVIITCSLLHLRCLVWMCTRGYGLMAENNVWLPLDPSIP